MAQLSLAETELGSVHRRPAGASQLDELVGVMRRNLRRGALGGDGKREYRGDEPVVPNALVRLALGYLLTAFWGLGSIGGVRVIL